MTSSFGNERDVVFGGMFDLHLLSRIMVRSVAAYDLGDILLTARL